MRPNGSNKWLIVDLQIKIHNKYGMPIKIKNIKIYYRGINTEISYIQNLFTKLNIISCNNLVRKIRIRFQQMLVIIQVIC